jgi:hypothetical protein
MFLNSLNDALDFVAGEVIALPTAHVREMLLRRSQKY